MLVNLTYINEKMVPFRYSVICVTCRTTFKTKIAPELCRLLTLFHSFNLTANFLMFLHQSKVIHSSRFVSVFISRKNLITDPQPCSCCCQNYKCPSWIEHFSMTCWSFVTLHVQVFHNQPRNNQVRIFSLVWANQKHARIYRQRIKAFIEPFMEPH